jgi:uncharacterized protein
MTTIGRVVHLFRFPMKSLRGESLTRVDVTENGFHGDRNFGIVDAANGRLLSAKTVPQLLEARAVLRPDGQAELTIGDGPAFATDDNDAHRRLSSWLGREVVIARPVPEQKSSIDIEVDRTGDGGGEHELFTFQSRPGLFFDGTAMHVLTTASLATMAERVPDSNWLLERFRPNIVVDVGPTDDPFPEDAWVGSPVTIGDMVLDVHKRCDRCVLVTRAVDSAPADREVLRALHREHGGDLGVKATIASPGTIRIGDTVTI